MMEFLRNCYAWIMENYKSVTVVITSTQFISLVSAVVLLIKSIKRTTENTVSSQKLGAALKNTNALSTTVDDIKSELNSVRDENHELKKQLQDQQNKLIEYLDSQSTRIAAMLEVQSVVYSTIKDDKIRNTVNSLLINAKYAETSSRVKLQEEVEALRAKVAEKMSEVTQDVEDAVNVVKGIVNPEASETTDSSAENTDVTRY